jgi:hypothetical protein
MEAGTGGDDGGSVVPLVEPHERMVGAARQQRAIDERCEPGQDRPKKLAR